MRRISGQQGEGDHLPTARQSRRGRLGDHQGPGARRAGEFHGLRDDDRWLAVPALQRPSLARAVAELGHAGHHFRTKHSPTPSTVARPSEFDMVPLSNLGAIMTMISRLQQRGILPALALIATGGSALAQVTTTYGYDPQGQVRQVSSSTQNTTYGYDAAGNRTAVTNAAPLTGLAVGSATISSAAAPTAKISQRFVFPAPPALQTALPPPPFSPPPAPRLPATMAAQSTAPN